MKLLVILASTLLLSNAALAVTVGKVDVKKVVTETKEGKKMKARLEKEFKAKQAELQKDQASLQKEIGDFQKKISVLSDKKKQEMGIALQQKDAALKQKTMKYQQEIQAKEQKLGQPIMNKIRAVIISVSKSKKVDFTVEANATPLIYAKKEVDLTNDVIKAYNKKHPGK